MPSPVAAGPFNGMQGGAIAGLLVGQMEAAAAKEEDWGDAVALSVWFLKPTPVGPVKTKLDVLRTGSRVSVIDNTLTPVNAREPTAIARATFMRRRPVEAPRLIPSAVNLPGPEQLEPRSRRPPHGGPWFMDVMEARVAGGVTWFRMRESVVEGAGPMASIVGPSDWTHGLARPLENVLADPNPNLNVHLLRPPVGGWIGICAAAEWLPVSGTGFGRGVLVDTSGEIGAVSMSIALTSFPTTAPRLEN